MRLDRLISIIMLLLERETVSAAELAESFGVSTRTIYRDLDAINQAGIPIVSKMGVHGGAGIMQAYKVDKRLFSASDLTSLLIGLGGAQAVRGEGLDTTLAKVRGLIPQSRQQEIEAAAGRIAIDLEPWYTGHRLRETMELAQAALDANRVLNFDYISGAGQATRRCVEPQRLLYKGNSWYLQGYCRMRGAWRTFRLSRIEHMAMDAEVFTPRPFSPAVFDAIQPPDTPMVEADIRFDALLLREIVDFYGEGVITSHEGGTCTARVTIMDNEQGYSLLLSYGERCECLSPPYVRAYLAQKAEAVARMYRGDVSTEDA